MEENKFICQHCGREFLTARGLSKHENNYCENNLNKIRPKKSYKICDKCGEEISTLAFNRHYKSVTVQVKEK